MLLQTPILENLRFLLAEVSGQIHQLTTFFELGSHGSAQHIIEHAGYAYNLKQRIQNACLDWMAQDDHADAMIARATTAIAIELETIAELCRDCVDQTSYLRGKHSLDLTAYLPLLARVTKALNLVESALLNNDTKLALKLGRTENKLERSSRKLVDRYTEALKTDKKTEDLVAGLLIARTISRMGSALLTISESILSTSLGQSMDTARFASLRDAIGDWINDDAFETLNLHQVAETRSGSDISAVNVSNNGDAVQAIFKEGAKRKVKEERSGVERWHDIFPGIAPQILTYKKQGRKAALLIEHLDGATFEDVVQQGPGPLRKQAMLALGDTLDVLWTQTRQAGKLKATFTKQISQRLDEVFAVHPSFKDRGQKLCGLQLPSLDELLAKAAKTEAALTPEFSVFIHGDFNIDNIIYDQSNNKINFIDLHRSTHQDYVQDVSVFMISNLRLQVMDKRVRKRIRQQCLDMYDIARDFANSQADKRFEARLALGLARSYITSTRFIRDKELARRLFLCGRFLLNQISELSPKKADRYRVPMQELLQ